MNELWLNDCVFIVEISPISPTSDDKSLVRHKLKKLPSFQKVSNKLVVLDIGEFKSSPSNSFRHVNLIGTNVSFSSHNARSVFLLVCLISRNNQMFFFHNIQETNNCFFFIVHVISGDNQLLETANLRHMALGIERGDHAFVTFLEKHVNNYIVVIIMMSMNIINVNQRKQKSASRWCDEINEKTLNVVTFE